MIRITVCIILALGLGACSVLPTEQHSTDATDTLLAQANAKAANGETQQAIATLERAVRLQPRNAQAWLRLAELYLEQGQYRKAEQFAGRAQQFAAGDRQLLRRSEAVIKQAREQQKLTG